MPVLHTRRRLCGRLGPGDGEPLQVPGPDHRRAGGQHRLPPGPRDGVPRQHGGLHPGGAGRAAGRQFPVRPPQSVPGRGQCRGEPGAGLPADDEAGLLCRGGALLPGGGPCLRAPLALGREPVPGLARRAGAALRHQPAGQRAPDAKALPAGQRRRRRPAGLPHLPGRGLRLPAADPVCGIRLPAPAGGSLCPAARRPGRPGGHHPLPGPEPRLPRPVWDRAPGAGER